MSAKKGPRTFDVGARVFAKVRGYPAWPARVETVSGSGANTKYSVFFYGTYESATVKANELFPYDKDTLAKFGKQKRKGFDKALIEIENNPDLKTAEMLMEEDNRAAEITGGTDAVEQGQDAEAGHQDPAEEEVEAPPMEKATSASKKKAATPSSAAASTPTAPSRGSKRKAPASSSQEEGTDSPAAKVARAAPATPATPAAGDQTPGSESRTSRSGRLIKSRKFLDDVGGDGSTSSTPIKGDDKSAAATASEEKKGERKIYVQVKATGDFVEINMDKDRPAKFDSKDAEIQWERATAKNALKFKDKVESGEFIPEEVRRKIEEKVHRTPEEEAILKREKQNALRKDKVLWLKAEQRLLDLDLDIKRTLHFERPDMPACIRALEELNALQLSPLMLKKQPDIVTTVRKLRKYVGPQSVEDPGLGEEWTQDSRRIRLKAQQIYMKLQNAFAVPEGGDFWEVFETKLAEFRAVTSGMDHKQLLTMVQDPTKVLEAAG